MKVNICNLGIVKKADIELKPLTVFLGENGTGKTWTAYAISTILAKDGFARYLDYYLKNETTFQYPILKEIIEQLIKEGNAKLNLVNFVQEYGEIYINEVGKFISQNMSMVMDTERANFSNFTIKFCLDQIQKNLSIKLKKDSINKSIGKVFTIFKEKNDQNIYFYSILEKEQNNILDKIPKKVVKEVIISTIFQFIHQALSSFVYAFPTERTTFITLPFYENWKEEISRKEEFLEDDKSSNIIPFAIKSLMEIIVMSSQITISERYEQEKLKPQIAHYINLANILEQNILRGYIDFEKSHIKSELLFEFSENQKLEMPIVSSMVKELAPLVLCLRYLAEPDELLVIDEPEMNLHPAAQVEIIEFLAMLVNAGLNVLITTHSPYIVDHLSNLIKASKFDEARQNQIKNRFYLENKGAFIDQDKVSVYLFEEGTAKNILDDQGNINWSTFGNVSDDIMNMLD